MSKVTISSTTSSQEELEHAAGPNWREPFVPKEAPKEEAAAPEAEKPETAAEPEPAEPPESKEAKHKGGWQKRIDKLTARNNAAETRAEKAERELSELRAQMDKPTQPAEDLPPQLKDFTTPEEWADARDAWKATQAEKQEQAEESQKTIADYNKAAEKARGEYEDWEEVVGNPEVQIPMSVHSAIIEMGKDGPPVAYYLGQHPEICEELMAMKPLAAVVRIGKIADSLAAKSSPEVKPKQKPPAPISTVGAASAKSSVPLDQMPIREFMKVRNAQEAARRR